MLISYNIAESSQKFSLEASSLLECQRMSAFPKLLYIHITTSRSQIHINSLQLQFKQQTYFSRKTKCSLNGPSCYLEKLNSLNDLPCVTILNAVNNSPKVFSLGEIMDMMSLCTDGFFLRHHSVDQLSSEQFTEKLI